MQTTVFCRTKVEGVHCYPHAPEEVAHLRNPHRHMFGIEVEMDVFDDDREVEFIVLKHRVEKWLKVHLDADGVWQLHTMSCEQIGKEIVNYLKGIYCVGQQRQIVVTVDEDGENGAVVYGDFVNEN